MEYLKLTDENQYQFCDKEEAGFVLIPIKEYNGLQNALRSYLTTKSVDPIVVAQNSVSVHHS